METGHLLKWKANSVRNEKFDSDWDGPVVLTNEHISAVILIFLSGIALGSLAFIGELLAFKNIPKKKHGFWKWMDKFMFDPDGLVWRSRLVIDK